MMGKERRREKRGREWRGREGGRGKKRGREWRGGRERGNEGGEREGSEGRGKEGEGGKEGKEVQWEGEGVEEEKREIRCVKYNCRQAGKGCVGGDIRDHRPQFVVNWNGISREVTCLCVLLMLHVYMHTLLAALV